MAGPAAALPRPFLFALEARRRSGAAPTRVAIASRARSTLVVPIRGSGTRARSRRSAPARQVGLGESDDLLMGIGCIHRAAAIGNRQVRISALACADELPEAS